MPTPVDVLAAHGCRPGVDAPRQDDFLDACNRGLVDVVRAYLDLGMPTTAQGTHWEGPPLCAAARGGSIAVVELLVERGAALEDTNYIGNTALRVAIDEGHEAVVRRLAELGASLDAPNEYDQSALEHAIDEGKRDNVRHLLALGANPNFVYKGRSAMCSAVGRGAETTLRLLFEHGASASLVLDDHGVTALHLAIRSYQSTTAALLLAHGADPDARDAYGLTPLDYALEFEDKEIEAQLGEPTPQQRARARMWQKVARGALDEALATLEREDLPIETRSARHQTLLTALSAAGHFEGVRRLLARGANPAPPRVATAAAKAVEHGHDKVLGLLLAAKAPLFEAGSELAEFAHAVNKGHIGVVRRVLQATAPERRADFAAYVYLAVLEGNPELVRCFIDHGVPLEHPQVISGETPLMTALTTNFSPEVATLLLDAGASLDSVDNRQNTALHKLVMSYSWKDDHEPMLRELLARGARLDAINWQHLTPFAAATDDVKPLLIKIAVVERVASDPPVEEVTPGQNWATLSMFYAAGLKRWVRRLLDAGVAFEPPPGPHGLLEQAIANDDVALVKALIARGTDVNHRTSYGSTPLIAAASRGATEVVQHLIAAGADLDAVNDFGATAVHAAATHPALLPVLAAAGARFDQRVHPPIIAAAGRGDPKSFEFFLAHGAILDGVGPYGSTALVTAITEGHEAIALQLIAAGAPPNQRGGRDGELPITAAAKQSQVAVVKALIAAGAAPTDKNAQGEDMLTTVSRRKELRAAFAEFLAPHGGGTPARRFERLPEELITVTPVWAAVYGGDFMVVARALEAGELGLDERDPWGLTPLMVAKLARADGLAGLMFREGANPVLQDPLGCTAWDYADEPDQLTEMSLKANGVKLPANRFEAQAARRRLCDELQGYFDRGEHEPLVAALRERRLHPHLGLKGRSIMIDAIERGDEPLVLALIDLGLPLELRSSYNYTPLNTALSKESFELADHLADAGVNTRIPGLLQSFLNFGQSKAADWMLSHGLDLRTPDQHGDLPIHEAAKYGQLTAVRMILERDPGVLEARNRDGLTPLMCARRNRSTGHKVIPFLLEAADKSDDDDDNDFDEDDFGDSLDLDDDEDDQDDFDEENEPN